MTSRSFWAVSYFKLGIIIVIASLVIIGFLLSDNFDHDVSSTKWRNVKTGYTWTETKDNDMNLVIPIALIIGAISGLCVLLFKKGVFDFDTTYVPMKEASEKRKRILRMAIFLGFFGVDRFCMRKIFTGTVKLLLFIAALIASVILVATKTEPALSGDFLVPVILIYLTLFWWTSDIIYLSLGATKEKGKHLLR
jgi:TM2 domain-containing membrane protein YozV